MIVTIDALFRSTNSSRTNWLHCRLRLAVQNLTRMLNCLGMIKTTCTLTCRSLMSRTVSIRRPWLGLIRCTTQHLIKRMDCWCIKYWIRITSASMGSTQRRSSPHVNMKIETHASSKHGLRSLITRIAYCSSLTKRRLHPKVSLVVMSPRT